MSVFYLAGAPAGHRGRSLVTTNFGLLCPSSWGPKWFLSVACDAWCTSALVCCRDKYQPEWYFVGSRHAIGD